LDVFATTDDAVDSFRKQGLADSFEVVEIGTWLHQHRLRRDALFRRSDRLPQFVEVGDDAAKHVGRR